MIEAIDNKYDCFDKILGLLIWLNHKSSWNQTRIKMSSGEYYDTAQQSF